MNALLPPEFPAPVFEWWGEVGDTSTYEVSLFTNNKEYEIHATTVQQSWIPGEAGWDSIKTLSNFEKISFTVKRKGNNSPASVSFRISRDSVGAPILYRQMPIPFLIAEKQLDSMNFMLINIGSKQKPHIAMKGFSVCGNCHSFTADGSEIGLDLDAGFRDKGGYFVSEVEDTIQFKLSNFRSWSKIEKRRTFGLFSKLSPDGRYIVTTVKDRVLVKNFKFPPVENVYYSQLFFPVNGHLAVYDRQTDILKELPGANLDEYVQSNATWTADGKNIIFSRADALPTDSSNYDVVVTDEELINQYVERKKTLKYDLCIIPFNNGNGGKAELLEAASNNGKSNYFPAVSPDGKWLIFCQADNFMLLMPDSRLFIIPVSGGKAKELKCNFNSMNSWHAWSPNSKWMVYASKGLSPITDMFLSHIDEKGNASIPVLVHKARTPYRVINYPEFVNQKPEKTFVMNYDFVELAHIERAVKSGDWEKGKQLYYKFEKQESFFFKEDYKQLSKLLKKIGLPEEAKKYDELAKQTVDSTVFNN
ncbi:MAG: PD40 domain-containing protein [Cyclobacteriaceae bacterium]|nr:PD40 domain-containing protein [Cyclobacteriaceae bacterium]